MDPIQATGFILQQMRNRDRREPSVRAFGALRFGHPGIGLTFQGEVKCATSFTEERFRAGECVGRVRRRTVRPADRGGY
jgi:hypothetical protein